MAAGIGTLGTIDVMTVGGVQHADPQNSGLIEAYAYTTGTSFTTFVKTSVVANTGYQVTTGKTHQMTAIRMMQTVGSGTPTAKVLYGDTAVFLSGSAPTTPKYVNNDTSSLAIACYGTTEAIKEVGYRFQTPSQKYPAMQGSGSNVHLFIYGYEI